MSTFACFLDIIMGRVHIYTINDYDALIYTQLTIMMHSYIHN